MKFLIIFLIIGVVLIGSYCLLNIPPDIRNSSPTGENIICFGNSLTFGTGASKGMDYPAQLSRMIEKPVINKGVPGEVTAIALRRLEKDVLSQSPRIVIIILGANDAMQGISKKDAFFNLKTMVRAIQEKGALVVIGGVEIPFVGKGYSDEYKQLAKETGSLLVPNVMKDILGNSRLMSDRIHPNDAGYTVMAKYFYKVIAKDK